MTTITFYFDPISPYVWLASKQLGALRARGHTVAWQPVLFAGLLHAHGQKGPAEIAAKRSYTFRDVMRQAAQRELVFRGPPGHPFNPLLALRMSVALSPADRARFGMAVLAACWERGQDISQSAVLVAIADACDLDGPALADAAGEARVKAELAANTEQAIGAGVFGVPTFQAGQELFWGGDRIDALLWHLDGHDIDEANLNDFLARAPLAQRRLG
ncbi:MAG: 2-hydroxychromene-2-carboxylate isomerase [Pseudomonadota bacterium]